MLSLRSLTSITPTASPTASALSYVPLVTLSRGLAFIRVLLVAKLLGDAGQSEFGLYQPALELVNWLVPLVMLGMGDVAERYAAQYEKEGRLAQLLKRHLIRLAVTAALVLVILLASSYFLVYTVFKLPTPQHPRSYGIMLVAACALTILLLATYQYLAAMLRGSRAYAAAAGMESLAAILFLLLSALAAWRGGALDLLYMYALSLLIPILFYSSLLLTHVKRQPGSQKPEARSQKLVTPPPPAIKNQKSKIKNSFAAFTFLRLMLVMTFGFLSVWGVGHLAAQLPNASPQQQTAAYSLPYRIAQLLAYVAITLWASTYALCARAWSHGQTRRARAQLFRVGKFGAVILTVLALILLLARGLLAAFLPSAYSAPINHLLPPLLAMFIWYGLLAFAAVYADLQEAPQKGAALWAAAVIAQLILIASPLHGPETDPAQQVLFASAMGLGIALLVFAPLILWHPFRLSATAVPLVLLALAPLSLFAPWWVVDYVAPPILLAALALLFLSGLLIRPIDHRAWRKFRTRLAAR